MTKYTLIIILLSFTLSNKINSQIVTNSVVAGGVTDNSARFWIRTSEPASINVELSTNADFDLSIFGEEKTSVTGTNNSVIIDVEGLSADTKYFYRVIINENPEDFLLRSFETFPPTGSKSTFSFAFGSCQQAGYQRPAETNSGNVFNEINLHEDLRFFLQLGDWTYPDTTDLFPVNNDVFASDYFLVQKSYENKYRLDYPMDKILRKMPVDYVYDDHDFLNNNSSALTTSFHVPFKPSVFGDDFFVAEIENPAGARENSIAGYKENVPTYPLENESRGIYHKFRYGNVEIFALDLRAQRSGNLYSMKKNAATERWEFAPPPGHTILGRDTSPGSGENQHDWFLRNLKESDADWKFIISSVPFNISQLAAIQLGIILQDSIVNFQQVPEGTTAIFASFEMADKWVGFPEDFTSVLSFISDNDIQNVIVLSGDSHNAGMDDGTNAGLPEIMAGGLDITNSKVISIFESFGIRIWNKGAQGVSTDKFNNAFGKLTVYGADSVKMELIDEFGERFANHTVLNSNITGVEKEFENLRDNYNLSQNYPNPFNPVTTIKFSIPWSQFVTLKVFDILGREMKTLIEQNLNAGEHSVDFGGEGLPSGTYIYQIHAGSYIMSRKMTLLK